MTNFFFGHNLSNVFLNRLLFNFVSIVSIVIGKLVFNELLTDNNKYVQDLNDLPLQMLCLPFNITFNVAFLLLLMKTDQNEIKSLLWLEMWQKLVYT